MTTTVHVLNLGPGAVEVNILDAIGRAVGEKKLYNHQAGIMTVYDGQSFRVDELKITPGVPITPPVTTFENLPTVPGGWVPVRPMGVHGAGKIRMWPANPPGEGPWSYADRLSKLVIDGKQLWQTGRYMSVSMAMSAHNFSAPEAVDFLTYTDDWRSQAEIDALQHKDDRPWISTPTPPANPPGPVDVPIGSEP